MYQDYRGLLSAFHAHGVKYLVVGGFAVIFHAQPGLTKEPDLFEQANLEDPRAGVRRDRRGVGYWQAGAGVAQSGYAGFELPR
jgi:hypothetical protein